MWFKANLSIFITHTKKNTNNKESLRSLAWANPCNLMCLLNKRMSNAKAFSKEIPTFQFEQPLHSNENPGNGTHFRCYFIYGNLFVLSFFKLMINSLKWIQHQIPVYLLWNNNNNNVYDYPFFFVLLIMIRLWVRPIVLLRIAKKMIASISQNLIEYRNNRISNRNMIPIGLPTMNNNVNEDNTNNIDKYQQNIHLLT